MKALLIVAALVDLAMAALMTALSGFILNRNGKTTAALIVAWVPPAGAAVAALIPPPY